MKADLLFRNGSTLTPAGPASLDVAVREGTIIAVGDDAVGTRAATTEEIDLAGGLLSASFQDAHAHPISAGLSLSQCDLRAGRSPEEYLEMLRSYAATHPDKQWIVGDGWNITAFGGHLPTAQALDSVCRDRPVMLSSDDGHSAWVNTEALRRASLTESTPDPADGRIERTTTGAPSGLLFEGAKTLVKKLLPPTSAVDFAEALRRATSLLHSVGVTAWQDAIVARSADDLVSAYCSADAGGALDARVVGALWWDRSRGLEQIDELVEKRRQLSGNRFQATSVKIMVDGVIEYFSAALLDPYLGSDAGQGSVFIDPQDLCLILAALEQNHFDAHFHAIGDRAVRDCLDAVEYARARRTSTWSPRHQIAHVQLIDGKDVSRFAALDVTANLQMLWATHDPDDPSTEVSLGQPRASRQYPFASLSQSGAHLAAGSDWAVSSPNPLSAIEVAVTRRPPGAPATHPALNAEQSLSLLAAWNAYTQGSARVNRLEASTGSVSVGKRADLIALDRNPFEGPTDEIALARVRSTFLDGVAVFTE